MATQVGAGLGLGALLLDGLPSGSGISGTGSGAGDRRPARSPVGAPVGAPVGGSLDLSERGGARTRRGRFQPPGMAPVDASHPRCGATSRPRGTPRDHPGRSRDRSLGPSRSGAPAASPPLTIDTSLREPPRRRGARSPKCEVVASTVPDPTGPHRGRRRSQKSDGSAEDESTAIAVRFDHFGSLSRTPARSIPASHAPST